MIIRAWHGWTTPDDADAYARLLNQHVVPGIVERDIPGLRHVDVLRRRGREQPQGEHEFLTLMAFDDWSAVEAFAGPRGTASVVPGQARALLSRFDEHSQHYELVGSHGSPASPHQVDRRSGGPGSARGSGAEWLEGGGEVP